MSGSIVELKWGHFNSTMLPLGGLKDLYIYCVFEKKVPTLVAWLRMLEWGLSLGRHSSSVSNINNINSVTITINAI